MTKIDPHQVRMGEPHARTLFSPARHKCLYGGRGSAKSWSVATYLAILAARRQKRIVCARQFQNSIRDSSKELIEKRAEALGLIRQFDVTEREVIHKRTGSRLTFVGLDRNVDSIRSLEGADIVWIEEARTISNKSMEILLPTIRRQHSELVWTWNPEQPTDPVDAFFRKGEPPPRSIITRVSYLDNPWFWSTSMPEEAERLRKGNADRWRSIWGGDYDRRYESKVFPNTRVGRLEIPVNTPPKYGLDFGEGGADPTAIIKLYVLERTKQIYIAAEAVGHPTLAQLPAFIRSVARHEDDLIVADSSAAGYIEHLANVCGFRITGARKGAGSIMVGVNFLQSYEIVIDPNCEAMREEARLYSFEVDRLTNTVLPGAPVDAYNHCWDAVRYATENSIFAGDLDEDPSGGVIRLRGLLR